MELLTKYNVISVIIFVGVIILAHLLSSSPYDWKNNTISELAAQGYSYRWVMKIGFILFGGILAVGIIKKWIDGESSILIELPFLIYGIAILISGLYSTKPIVDVHYSQIESHIHSYAAQLAGISFSIGLLLKGIMETDASMKVAHFVTFFGVVGLSALFGILECYTGIIQRVMYLSSFIWLIFYYNK